MSKKARTTKKLRRRLMKELKGSFQTKWILDKAGLSEEELLHRMRLNLTTIGKLKIKIEDRGIC